MSYRYDVFISYKNCSGVSQWVEEHFYPYLFERLACYLPAEPRIFRDKSSIDAGDEWDQKIKEALADSKILVAVVMPRYFTSNWCVAEWQSVELRERMAERNRNKLLIPIKFSNCDYLPQFATKRMITSATDFTDVNYRSLPPKSESALALERRTDALAQLIASRLPFVPQHTTFPVADPDTVKLPKLPPPSNPTA